MGQKIRLYSSQDFTEALAELVFVILILIFAPDYWFLAMAVCFPLIANIYRFFKAENRTLKWISDEPEQQLSYEEFYSSNGDFQFYDWGFIKIVDNQESIIKWYNVLKITAYKRDLITEDQICLQIELNNDYFFTTSEDVEGWFSLIRHLEKEFPEVSERNIMQIAVPAFARNETVLFSRDVKHNDLVK